MKSDRRRPGVERSDDDGEKSGDAPWERRKRTMQRWQDTVEFVFGLPVLIARVIAGFLR